MVFMRPTGCHLLLGGVDAEQCGESGHNQAARSMTEPHAQCRWLWKRTGGSPVAWSRCLYQRYHVARVQLLADAATLACLQWHLGTPGLRLAMLLGLIAEATTLAVFGPWAARHRAWLLAEYGHFLTLLPGITAARARGTAPPSTVPRSPQPPSASTRHTDSWPGRRGCCRRAPRWWKRQMARWLQMRPGSVAETTDGEGRDVVPDGFRRPGWHPRG